MVPIDCDYKREVKDFIDIPTMFTEDLKDLPSKFSEDFGMLKESFRARKEYIAHVGFPLISKEFASELKEIFIDLEIDSFAEIEAGNGVISTLLNNLGFEGKGYTLDPDTIKHNWGIQKSPIFERAREQQLLEFINIRKLKLKTAPDIIVASWIPYEGGDEVLEFFNNHSDNQSEYFMVIGEGHGGCTANDEFHDWLDNKFEHIWMSKSYEPFMCIYDSVCIYKRKSDPNYPRFDEDKL